MFWRLLPKHVTMDLRIFFLSCMSGAAMQVLAQQGVPHDHADGRHWISLTDSVGQVIGMSDQQRSEWKPRNAEWDRKFQALGAKPEHKSYIKLHHARELDIRGFLTGGQYDKWKVLNRRSPRLEPGNPPGTNMPPTR